MTPDASVIAVSFYYVGTCAFHGLNDYEADSQGVAYRSLDGGITWQEIARGGPVFNVDAVLTDGDVIVTRASSDDSTQPHFFRLPENSVVTVPDGTDYPPVTISNTILWPTGDGQLLTADGKPFGPTHINRYYKQVLGSVSDDLQRGSALTYWYVDAPNPRPSNYVDRFGIEELNVSDGVVSTVQTWQLEGSIAGLGHWDQKLEKLIVSVAVPSADQALPLPTIVDLTAGTYSVIPSPFEDDSPGRSSFGRTYVDSVQVGPFARVTRTGSCLKVRAEPSRLGRC